MSAREQAGVIPFRRAARGVELCLMRRIGGADWKIPKGFIDGKETPEEAALKEAWEEAGIEGRLVGDPIGVYEYEKWDQRLRVVVFLMEVTREHDEWDESHVRERCWAGLDEALSLLRKHPVRPLVEAARARLERRRKPRGV